MKIPVVRGVIDRRMLINYRVDPAVLSRQLPPPFRPKLVRGQAVVGVCLIRLREVRPKFLPPWLGIGSENAAHRAAVVWDEGDRLREGVYVRRRDTDSRLNAWTGGRLFPGFHHHARFNVRETADQFQVSVTSDDARVRLSVKARLAGKLPGGSIFSSLEECSAFFAGGSMGYSATPAPGRFQGLELRCDAWEVEPLEVDEVRSSVFDDRTLFPAGSLAFDCALLMRGVAHEWHAQEDLCCGLAAARRLEPVGA